MGAGDGDDREWAAGVQSSGSGHVLGRVQLAAPNGDWIFGAWGWVFVWSSRAEQQSHEEWHVGEGHSVVGVHVVGAGPGAGHSADEDVHQA